MYTCEDSQKNEVCWSFTSGTFAANHCNHTNLDKKMVMLNILRCKIWDFYRILTDIFLTHIYI